MKSYLRFKYILITIIAIQIFSSSILMYLGHYQYISILEMHTKHETIRANKIYKNVFKEVNKVYSVLSETILTEEVIETFAQKDREKLYSIVLPKFKELQKLNKYVENIHFHTADLHSFLRLHKPDRYGDDLSVFRPLLVKENQMRKKLYGLELGKHGLFYRIVLPIYKDREYLGSMELGIDIKFLLKRLNQFSELKSFMFLEKNQTSLMHKFDEEKAKTYFQEYDSKQELLRYYGDEKLKKFLTLIGKKKSAINKVSYQVVSEKGEVYLIHNGLILKDYANKRIGSIVFMQKLNYYFDTVAIIRFISIATTVLLLLFSIALMYILIRRHTDNLHLKEKELTELASMDQLTKIANRYSFNKIFTQELKINSRNLTSLSFLMVDIDSFKQYNDSYGHPMGDKILKIVAQSMKDMLKRPSDHIFRVGGEEFVILYSGLLYSDAVAYGEALVHAIDRLNIKHEYNKPYENITISIGLCHVDNYENIDEEAIYKNADEALYEAKKYGKNILVSRQYS